MKKFVGKSTISSKLKRVKSEFVNWKKSTKSQKYWQILTLFDCQVQVFAIPRRTIVLPKTTSIPAYLLLYLAARQNDK